MYVTLSGRRARQSASAFAPTDAKEIGKTIAAGTYLYFEGDDTTRLYIIKRGVLRLTRVLEDGRRQVIAFGYPGDVIGFPAQGRHHSDCDALADAELRLIPLAALESGGADPALHTALMTAALQEISAMQDHLMVLGRKSAAERVASFLVTLADRNGRGTAIDLPMSRSDIADFLGLTTETVSRCFTALRKAGIIRLASANLVDVADRTALTQRALGQLN
ncbi:helix-turn-helix domain-containing protein [Actibacterium sp. 188UL27-1]|uniref:helix-turn-helix domain-containing protein n=1 Tax=Actibacterium sp. 188UL27-1 TaxID=2786961 RepID=UPI00195B3EDC|nr:helix-turn-helix domain-containing protein [Actibacterium sp. 188UL27-1]MBM7069136.1 helix-turn-helix domain-containing protein [Actibacterium sp. 188UL27-1]